MVVEATYLDQVVRQNGNGFAAVLHDVAKLALSAELAVSDVKELRTTVNLTEGIPRFNVGRLIIAIARINVMVDGDGTIIGHAQAID